VHRLRRAGHCGKELADILKKKLLLGCQTPDWLKNKILQSLIHLRLLRITRADGKEETISVTEGVTTFGRHAKNTIILAGDNKVSRKHCQIEFKDGKYELADLNSKNGIQVNDKKVEQHTLSPGDKIRIGKANIVFEMPSGAKWLNSEETKVIIKGLPEIPHAKRLRRRNMFQTPAPASSSPSLLIGAGILAIIIIIGVFLFTDKSHRILGSKRPEPTVVPVENTGLTNELENLNTKINSLTKEYLYKEALSKARDFLTTFDSQMDDFQKYYLMAKIDSIDQLSIMEDRVTKQYEKLETELAVTPDLIGLKGKYTELMASALNTNLIPKIQSRITHIDELIGRQNELEKNLEALKKELEPEISRGNFAPAMNKYAAFKASTENLYIQNITSEEMDSVNRKAGADFESLREQSRELIGKKNYEKAISIFTTNQHRFEGTAYRTQFNGEVFAINKMISQEEQNKKQIRKSCIKLAGEADESAKKYDYDSAINKLQEALKNARLYSPDLDNRISERLKAVEKEYELFNKMRTGIKGRNIAIARIGLKGSVLTTTNESFYASGRSTKWINLMPLEIYEFYKISGFLSSNPDALALFALEHKLMDGVYESFNAIMKKSPSKKPELDKLLSDYTGKKIPQAEGGFIIYKEKWLTLEEKEAITSKEEAIAIAGKLKTATKMPDVEKNCSSFTRLAKSSAKYLEGFREVIVKSLQDKYKELNKTLDKKLGSINLISLKALKLELNKKRAEALKELRGGATEPGPGNKPKISAAMDKKINEVRTLWTRPLEKVVQLDKTFKDIVDQMVLLENELKKYAPHDENESDLDILSAIATEAKIDLKNIPLNGTEAKLISDNKKIMEENDKNTVASAEEKESIKIQNEYRIMMGLKAVRINDKLVQAARKHSQHMQSSGKFAHAGIGDGDPSSRANAEGFPGGASENIFMSGGGGNPQSNPQTSFTAWYWSHGHHLNIIGDWNVVGVGVAGGYYTTNFGR
jgi:uncharacterized protein YkwD